jgi:oligopeptide transport system substrate-binding protein
MILSVLMCIFSCTESKKQFEYSGGKISLCLELTYLNSEPSEIGDFYSQLILGQVYEGLVSINPADLTIQPQIASKIDITNKGLRYIFTIRDDVYFHNIGLSLNDRKLTPQDVVYSIKKACTKKSKKTPSHAFSLVYKNLLRGATDFYDKKTSSISGLSIKGNKVIMDLLQEDNNFLQKLSLISCAVISEKKSELNTEIVGTGPFILLQKNVTDERLLLLKNADYYLYDKAGNALPYLDSLEFIINTKKLGQLDLFENHTTDIILGLPTSRITKMLQGRIEDFNSKPPLFILHNNPGLVTNYYFFNMASERFKDKKVRQAFNYAINKEKIGQNILRNQFYELGHYGIVPPLNSIFRGYHLNDIRERGYLYDPEKAKALLASAGYPEGKGFGNVTLRFNINDIHSAVADEFSKQIKQVLNINVNIDGSTFQQLTVDGDNGNGDIFRAGWAADYPSPESFLNNFFGELVPNNPNDPSHFNQSRYINDQFDNYLKKGKSTNKLAESQKYFSMADRELLLDPPFIPLWYNGEIQVVYSNVRNLNFNAMDLFVFKEVYKKEWTKEEFQKKMK